MTIFQSVSCQFSMQEKMGVTQMMIKTTVAVNGKNRLRHAYEVTFLDFQCFGKRPSPFIENNMIPTRHHLSWGRGERRRESL